MAAGKFGIVLAFSWKGAVIASAVMAFPLLVQPVRVAFRLIDERLEQAATTLGATPWNAFFPSRCHSRCQACWPVPCCASRAASASLVPRWLSSATFPAKHARCRWPYIVSCSCRTATARDAPGRLESIALRDRRVGDQPLDDAPRRAPPRLPRSSGFLVLKFESRIPARRSTALRKPRLALDTGATGICGPSGCGKSTLLALIAGLLRPDVRHAGVRRRNARGHVPSVMCAGVAATLRAGVPGRAVVSASLGARQPDVRVSAPVCYRAAFRTSAGAGTA